MSEHIARARIVADRLREISQIVDKLAWDLDTELSAIDKDEAGYREKTAANPDGGQNAIPGDLEAALFQAEAFLEDVRTWADSSHLEPQNVAIGYDWFPATLEGLSKARAYQKSMQQLGRVLPLKIIRGV